MLSVSAISQNITQSTTIVKDTTKICIPTPVARAIIVDLEKGKEAIAQVGILESKLVYANRLLATKDTLNFYLTNENLSLEKEIELYQLQSQQYQLDYDNLNREIKKQAALKTVFVTTTAVSVGALIVSLILGR